MLKRLEAVIEAALIASRWLMAPLYLGLIAALVVVGVVFFEELAHAVAGIGRLDADGVILAGLKLKVVVSLVAIAAVDLLESFVEIDTTNKTDLAWQIAILATFVVTGVLL